ncbi:MAG: FKBP-type peptidyl-prolyl cis-trans isomerase [Puniceicoccales bacterium]|jgi:FKBP-type peptidyl-prolyl cis-trans isomerase|nr:FKBP-type peptidyl-prolyl cis-trans isomerase [Puniceicoccales bacterium]
MKTTVIALALATLSSTPALFADNTAAAHTHPHGAAPAAAAAPAAPVAPKPPLTAAQKAQALELLGWYFSKGQAPFPLEVFGFSPAELDILVKGLRTGAEGQERDKEFNAVIPFLDQFLKEKADANRPKIEAKQQAKIAKLKQDNLDYLLKVDKEPGIQTTATGLRYKILAPGVGEKPLAASGVKALYTGKLIDGTVFDSTANRNNQPAEFRLNEVIPGWTEGLQKIAKGGKILLYIPSSLAYGDEGREGIPPMATLTFEVELVDILPPAPPPAPAPAPAPTAAPTPAPAAR